MQRILLLACAVTATSLSGCATTSFAPPPLKYDISFDDLSYSCKSPGDRHRPIQRNVAGAQDLIDIYVLSYSCAARQAADGRQWFEVPSFLSLVGATAAIAFGAGENVAIAGTTASAVFNAGKAYYVPQEKAQAFNHARQALACIENASVGIAAYTLPAADEVTEGRSRSRSGRGGSVSVPFELQYFRMVTSALRSVELILAQRLNKMGSFDPAGVAEQIKALSQEEEAAEEERSAQRSAKAWGRSISVVDEAVLELDVLQPKLQECVVRAKM